MATRKRGKTKRTAKWQKPLTLTEVRHLRENGAPTMQGVKDLFAKQAKIRAENEARGMRPGAVEPCFECKQIERKLIEAGVL